MRLSHALRSILLSFSLVSLATLLMTVLEPVMGPDTLFVLLAAVVISALYSELWVSVAAATLAAVLHNYFHQFPRHSFTIARPQDFFELFMFWLTSIVVSVFGNNLRAARQRAEQASLDREELLAVVSHDLKNPLTVVRTQASLLLQGRSGPERKSPELILEATGRMERLIRDLLDFEKMKNGRLEVHCQPLSASQLLEAIAQAMRPLADAKDIRMEWKLEGREFRLFADRERLLQVFGNIVGNAIKFSARGTRIRITAHGAGERARISVADEGPGIAPAQLPHIFDRYWQAKSTAHLGTGLGLAIAKGIIDAHHGEIRVESEPGRGTTFHVELPIKAITGQTRAA